MKEVQNLLVKLGELPPPGGRNSNIRVIDASKQPATYEYLLRLKEQWERVSPNSLVIPDRENFDSPEDPQAKPKRKPRTKAQLMIRNPRRSSLRPMK